MKAIVRDIAVCWWRTTAHTAGDSPVVEVADCRLLVPVDVVYRK